MEKFVIKLLLLLNYSSEMFGYFDRVEWVVALE